MLELGNEKLRSTNLINNSAPNTDDEIYVLTVKTWGGGKHRVD